MDPEPAEAAASPPPREAVRFTGVTAEPFPDRRRIKLTYDLTPFLERPSVEIRLQDPAGNDLGSITIVETMTPRFSLTAHLRGEPPVDGEVVVLSSLGYEGLPDVDRHTLSLTLPGQSDESAAGPSDPPENLRPGGATAL